MIDKYQNVVTICPLSVALNSTMISIQQRAPNCSSDGPIAQNSRGDQPTMIRKLWMTCEHHKSNLANSSTNSPLLADRAASFTKPGDGSQLDSSLPVTINRTQFKSG